MNPLRRTRETHFSETRLLESRTPGVPFQMSGSAWWKRRRIRYPDVQAAVLDAVCHEAQDIAITRYADDFRGAQDAINANLGVIQRSRNTHFYSALTAKVTLTLSNEAAADALAYRHSVAYVKRLRFLREQLYSDPAMLMLDHLEKNPGKADDELPDMAHFQRLAMKISNGERWWCRILDAMDRLAPHTTDQNGNLLAMDVLIRVLKEAAPDYFKWQEEEEQATPPGATPPTAATARPS